MGCAHFKNFSFSTGAIFVPVIDVSRPYAKFDNVSYGFISNGGPGAAFVSSSADRIRIEDCFFGLGSFDFTSPCVLDLHGSTVITSAALGGAAVEVNIWDPEASISLSQGATLDINLGGSAGSVPTHGGGADWKFSCGLADFATFPALGAEMYAGAAFSAPTAFFAVPPVPQIPALAAPFRGFECPRDCYIRGISIEAPIPDVGGVLYAIDVYVSGILTLTETFFSTSPSGFSDSTFGAVDEGDIIETVIRPLVPALGGSLAEGLIVTIRAS